jgi:GAF domain-containing protein
LNQNRAQRYTTTLLALLGLLLGFTAGLLVDQAANVPFNGALLPAFKACGNCVEAAMPLLAEAIKVNAWTLLGAIAGLILGLAAAWVVRPRRAAQPFGQPKRLSGMRQAAELARFSRTLSDTLELQPILTRLHEEALRVTGADCGSSFLLDPESPEHRVALRVGEGADLHRLSPMEATAVASGRGRIVQDFEVEGEAPPHVGVRSALLVPITHEENAIGLIHLHSQQPVAFDAEFHDLVQALAAQAAVAIQNAQRYGDQSRRSEGLRQRVNQLQQLSQIPNTVRMDRPLTANLQSIAQTMRETADFSLVLISVFAPAGNQLVHTAAAGLAPETFASLQHLPLPWERVQPFLREENRNNRVYRVPHTHTADLYQALDLGRGKKPAEPQAPGQWHPDDILLVPLYGSRGEIEGLLSVGAPRDPQTPPSLVLEMLEIFASQAALAVENAQMLTQAEERVSESQERAVQLSVLTEAAGVIASALRVDDVVTLALDQLRRVIPYDTATFWQSEPSDRRWRVLGARSYQDAIKPRSSAKSSPRAAPSSCRTSAVTRASRPKKPAACAPGWAFRSSATAR